MEKKKQKKRTKKLDLKRHTSIYISIYHLNKDGEHQEWEVEDVDVSMNGPSLMDRVIRPWSILRFQA